MEQTIKENNAANEAEVVYNRFDKAKKKDTYKFLGTTQGSRFKVTTFQVNLPDEERRLLDKRLATKAFIKK